MKQLPRLALGFLGLALAALPGTAVTFAADDVAPPAPAAPAAKAAVEWIADFDKAVEKAKAEKKDLFVDFTGSDWCSWCIKLHDEVLEHAAFLDAASKEYVLVSLDYPHSPERQAKVPNPARNQELVQKYEVEGYPTVLLLTADGEVFGRTGYQPGGPEAYVEHMTKLRTAGRAALLDAIALAKEFESAKDDARTAAIEKSLVMVEKAGADAAWTKKLIPAVRAAIAADPKNEKGTKLRAVKALLHAGVVDDAVLAEARTLDPKNEQGLLEQVVFAEIGAVHDEETCRATLKHIEELDALGIKDKDTRQMLYANAAFWNFQVLSDKEKAESFAKKLKAIADPANPRLKQLIEAILGPDAEAPAEKGAAPEKKPEGPQGPEGGK